MKKTIKRALSGVLCLLMCLSMCACGNSSEPEPTPDTKPTTISQTEAEAIAKQAIVNICCEYSSYNKLYPIEQLAFNTYKIEKISREENCGWKYNFTKGETEYLDGWVVKVNGTYYPVDRYDEYGKKVYFTVAVEVYDDGGYSYSSAYGDNYDMFLCVDTYKQYEYYY